MNADSEPKEAPTRIYRQHDFDRSPMIVFYEITTACDLACLHCRASAQPEPGPGELSPADSRRLVDQLSQFPRSPMLVLTGGDPLKRADVFDLIEYATNSGLEVSITPSATPLVTETAVARLHTSGISRMAVSIDGADAETHDPFRGVKGSFDRSLRILSAAREQGLATQVNTTVTPQNWKQLDAIAQRIAKEGIVLWSVFFLVPAGRASEAARLSPEQYEQVFAELATQSRRQPFRIKTTEAPHYRRYMIGQRKGAGARAKDLSTNRSAAPGVPMGINDGKGIMFISHAGEIYPSGFMPILCGRFPTDNLVDIYTQSQLFQGLRDANRLQGKCGQCEFRTICGGSRARSYALTGNPYAEEPDCAYEPEGLAVNKDQPPADVNRG